MRVINETHWRSDQIKALAQRVARDELDPASRKRFTVRVRYGRRGSATSGHAHYHSLSCQVNLGSDAVDTVNLAHTLAHEMAHTRGTTHRQMRGSLRYTYVAGWRAQYDWAADFPLKRQVPKPKPTLDERRRARLERAQQNLAAWQRRLKMAAGKVRCWRGRVRDLERYTALAAQRPTPPEVQ